MAAVSERDAQVLEVERRAWGSAGEKESYVRRELGLSPARYYQVLNALIDDPDALALEPVLLGRLRRLRAERGRARSANLPAESV